MPRFRNPGEFDGGFRWGLVAVGVGAGGMCAVIRACLVGTCRIWERAGREFTSCVGYNRL